MYVLRTIEARSRNHFFPWKRNQYYIICACVYIFALVIQHANHVFTAPYYIFVCGLSASTILFAHYLIKARSLEKFI